MVEVVRFPTPNLKDVPASLRRLADFLESESAQELQITHAIVVASSNVTGDLNVYGYGSIENRAHEVGILQMASLQLAMD